jgi:hypothetical protein
MIATFVGIIGAFLILIVFLLNQFDKLKNDNFYYDFLNFLGSVFSIFQAPLFYQAVSKTLKK